MLPVENKLKPSQGRLLIAEPFMNDGYFRRSVVLLAEHSKQGALGFMLNKPVEIRLNELLEDFPDYKGSVFLGGPVQRDQLFYIHTAGDLIEDSVPITDGLWWNGNFETIRTLAAENRISPKQLRFFIGYSGWEPQQLEKEMEDRAWYVAKAKADLIFATEPGLLWANAVKSMGKPFTMMANFPQDPSLN